MANMFKQGKKGDLSSFKCSMAVGGWQAGLSISTPGIFPHNNLWGLQRMIWEKKRSNEQQFSCCGDSLEENSQTAYNWEEGYSSHGLTRIGQ